MMADWDGTIIKGNEGYRRKSIIDEEEFEEEEVWSVMKGREDSSSNVRKSSSSSSSSSSSAWSLPGTKPRMIPRGPEANNDDLVVQQSSAPLNIPDWSKIYGKNGKNMGSWVYDGDNAVCNDGYHANGYDDHENANDDDDDEGGLVPPHEWIARKLARSQISSFSVCEGVGRTLKGRDLSRVRNAVLTKTGFLEQ